ncbi:hypothetical protein [Jeotgalibacillus proteolyticus]|nr:hypothetical protein [Jeotgalibacillus proteolyticus]
MTKLIKTQRMKPRKNERVMDGLISKINECISILDKRNKKM